MQIHAKYSFKYALNITASPPPQTQAHHLGKTQTTSLPQVRLLKSGGGGWRVSRAPQSLTPVQPDSDVTGLKKTSTPFTQIGSPSHNQRVWTFQRLEFIPISVRQRRHLSVGLKRAASHRLEPVKDELFVSLRIWSRRKLWSLIAFLQWCARHLQRGREKSMSRGQSQFNTSFKQLGSPGGTKSPLLHCCRCHFMKLKNDKSLYRDTRLERCS